MKIQIITVLLVTLIAGCGGGGGGGSPTGPSTVTPKVYLDPANVTKTVGQDFTLNVYIENVTNLFYANVYLSYDPSKVAYKSSSEGSFLKQGGGSVSFNASDQNGVLIMGITRLGSSSGGASGTGILCSATFTAAAAGTSTVTINKTNSGFRDVNNNDITITVGNGSTVNTH